MKAVGYVRVSTQGQVEDGVSLEAQEAKIRAWAELNGYDEAELHVDAGISGAKMDKREGLQEALRAIKKGDALVVYSLSRLARSTKDTLEIADLLTKRGADLVSISEKIDTTTAAGKMVFRMLAVLSEFERDQIAERTKTAMAHKKSKRELVGSVPYGYRLAEDGIHLEESPEEQRVITEARRLRDAGLSLRGIAGALSRQGFRARNGREFAPTQINRILAA
jgi:DNA invertase Pin-like site-specific DNA recombinase